MWTPALCLVTGASRGIGLAFTSQLLKRSSTSTIIATSRSGSSPALDELRDAYPGRVVPIACDITQQDDCKALAARVKAEHDGKVELVLNVAGLLHEAGTSGLMPERSLASIDADAMAKVYATNAIGPVLMTQALQSQLAKGARIGNATYGKSHFGGLAIDTGRGLFIEGGFFEDEGLPGADAAVTYAAMLRGAVALGAALGGVGAGDAVAVVLRRCVELPVAVYGVLSTGAYYVPVDPDYPESRRQSMFDDAKPKSVVSSRTTRRTRTRPRPCSSRPTRPPPPSSEARASPLPSPRRDPPSPLVFCSRGGVGTRGVWTRASRASVRGIRTRRPRAGGKARGKPRGNLC